jgi:hypothetical protein
MMKRLEESINEPRHQWSPSTLRSLFEVTLNQHSKRHLSQEHGARWWNLIGFLLRPGFGYPLDDFRIKDLWKVILGDSKGAKDKAAQIQRLICYRRIAGGLSKGQQMQLAASISFNHRDNAHAHAEKVRALASFELLNSAQKVKLAEELLEKILKSKAAPCDHWAVARIGARHLLYGSIGDIVPKEICTEWLEKLMACSSVDPNQLAFLAAHLARKTDERQIDLPYTLIEKIEKHFVSLPQKNRLHELLNREAALTKDEQSTLFGESLPSGLELL